jgi:hypothetical protein
MVMAHFDGSVGLPELKERGREELLSVSIWFGEYQAMIPVRSFLKQARSATQKRIVQAQPASDRAVYTIVRAFLGFGAFNMMM